MMRPLPILFLCAASLLASHSALAQCTANAGPNGYTICAGGPQQLNGTANGGQNPYSFVWTPAAGLSNPNIANPICTATVTTVYTLTVTDGNGDVCTDNITITVLPTADATLTSSNALFTVFNGVPTFYKCSANPNSLFFFDFGGTATAGATHTITWGDGSPNFTATGASWATQSHSYGQGIYSLTYTITQPNGCNDTQIYSVFLGTNPAGALVNPGSTTGCGPLTLTFPIVGWNSNTPGTIYTVTFNDGTPPIVYSHPPPASITHVFAIGSCGTTSTDGINTYQNSFSANILIENPCGTSGSTVLPITVSLAGQSGFTISPNDTACVNSTVTFTSTSTGNEIQGAVCDVTPALLWSILPAAGWTIASGSLGNDNGFTGANYDPSSWLTGSQSLGINFNLPGQYAVTLVTGNSCGGDTLTQLVCIESPPVAAFTLTPAIGCAPMVSTVDNTSTSPNSCLTRYQWSVVFNGAPCGGAGTWSYSGGTSATSFEPQFTFTSPGNYTVTLQVINSCGTFPVSQSVTVGSPPQVTLNPLPVICAGQSVTPAATFTPCGNPIMTYAWTFTGGAPATSAVQNPGAVTYNTGGNYTITASATNACGTASDSEPLTVNPVPPAPVVNGPITLCAGQTLNLTSNTIPGATYSWTGPGGWSSSLEDPTITNITTGQAGNYVVTASIGGCVGPSSTVVVTVNSAPLVNIVPANPSICVGASVTLTANGSSNYAWTAGGVPAGAGASISVSPITTTVYTVVATPGGGCPGTATTTVTVNPLPVVNAGPDVTLCDQPIPYALTGFSPAGGSWSGSPNVTAGGVFTPNGAGTFNLTYTYTDGNGCVNNDQVTVTVNPLGAPANAGPNISLCVGDPAVQLPMTPPGGTWSGAGVTVGGLFNPIAAGSYNLTYTVGALTCQTSDVMTMTVSAAPVVAAGPDFDACSNDPIVNLVGAPPGGTWSGAGVTGSQWDPATAPAGASVLTYTFTNANNCTASDQVVATLYTLPVVDAGGPWNLCDQPIATTLTGATPVGGAWSGPFITPGGSFGGSGIGVFTVYYTYSDPNGCSAMDSTVVTVVPVANPANAGPDEVVCVGDPPFALAAIPVGGVWSGSIYVAANGTFTPSVAGTYILTYTFGNGSCVTSDQMVVTVDPPPTVNAGAPASYCIDDAPAQLNGTPVGGTWSGTGVSVGGLFDPALAGVGTHTLTYDYTSPVGCNNSNTVALTVNPLPIVDAGLPQVFCDQPFPQQLVGSPAGGTWSGPNVGVGGLFTPNGIGTFNLTYSYTDANGCTNTDNVQVDVVPVTNPAVAGADVSICVGSIPFQLAGAPAGGTWTGTPLVTPLGTFSPSVAGTYVLTYTVGTLTCLTSDQMTVVVNQLPQPAITSTPNVCFDAGVQTMTATPAGGTWSGAGIIDPVLGTFDPAVTGPGVFNITYTYTDANGCSNSTASLATVNALPVAAFTSDPIACLNAPFQFTDLSVGATGWAWDFGDFGTSGFQNPQHTYAALGQYTITLIASTGSGCDDTTSMVIDVWEPPYPAFTITPDSGCGPLTVAFDNLSTGNITGFNWDFGNGTSTTDQFPVPVMFQASTIQDTTYAITLTATNVCGSVDAVDSVQVMPAPTALFGTDYSQGCSPFTPLIANISSGLPDNYFWDFGDGTTGTTSSALFTHTYFTDTIPTTYTITLIVTNECGTDTTTQQVTVLPNTVTAFFNTDPAIGCSPLTVDFTQFTSGATFTSWDFGDGNVSALQDPSHTFFAGANDTTFTVTLFANNGCSFDTAYATVTVFAQPIVGFNYAPDSVCVDVEFQFTNTSQNAANYIWDFGDGNGSGLTDPVHAYSNSGIYPVMLTATSQLNGCVDSVIVPVTVITSPIVSIGVVPQFGCMPLDVQFTNTTTNAVFYVWDFDDGNTSGLQAPSHTYASDGVYLVQLIAENLSGCSDTGYTQVNVYPIPTAAFTFAPGQSCFSPADVQFDNNSSGAIGFQWDLGNGQVTALNDPVGTYNGAGTYTVELVAENQYGCTDTATADFTVYPTPVADYTVLPNPACATYPVQFTDNSQNNSIWQWYFGDGGTSTDEDPVYTYMQPGSYDITLIVQGAGGCTDTLTVEDGININPTPIADFGWDTLMTLDNALQFDNLSLGSSSWWWDFGDDETSTDFEPVHLFPGNGGAYPICLIALNELQCPDTVCKVITVPADLNAYVPNAFSPDGDGLNDGFRPIMLGFDESRWNYHFMIFDRWGQLFFDTRDRNAEWDGTLLGQPSPIDVYVWKVIMATEGDERDWVGHVTLVR
ncbi:MAG: PKD domain-containing protein [Flavobacteriales bacterium]|nr:PKD domain-containing protein [Flavobacteriales bacterium]